MEIVPIFGPEEDLTRGLLAIRYEPDQPDELERLFDLWRDYTYLNAFANANLPDIPGPADENQLDRFILAVKLEADELEGLLYDAATGAEYPSCLQEIFRPLTNSDTRLVVLQPSKTSARTQQRRHPMLRIYGIRIDRNTYIVSGGAIKLTHFMNERKHTEDELIKMNRVIDWLRTNQVYGPDDLTNLNEP